jgi:hypothetical protein
LNCRLPVKTYKDKVDFANVQHQAFCPFMDSPLVEPLNPINGRKTPKKELTKYFPGCSFIVSGRPVDTKTKFRVAVRKTGRKVDLRLVFANDPLPASWIVWSLTEEEVSQLLNN